MSTQPSRSDGPLVVARDPVLLGALSRICAAAGVTADVTADDQSVRRLWSSSSCVVVADECAEEVEALDLARRADVFLVGQGSLESEIWRRGVALHADAVMLLPDDQRRLIQRLTDSLDGASGRAALTVGVIGARGGAGASTVAAGLGLVAAASGGGVLLIDADPWGGGVELVLGCEDRPGLRWPGVAATRGRVGAQALRSALPSHHGVSVLSCARVEHPSTESVQSLDPVAMRSVIDAGRRGSDLVVLDLPRRAEPASLDACAVADVLLLVTTPDVRSTAAATALLSLLRRSCRDIRLVVRVGRGSGLTAPDVADAVELPLAAEIRTRGSLRRSVDDGLGPLATRRCEREFRRLLEAVRSGSREPR